MGLLCFLLDLRKAIMRLRHAFATAAHQHEHQLATTDTAEKWGISSTQQHRASAQCLCSNPGYYTSVWKCSSLIVMNIIYKQPPSNKHS
jgi:hypothetical protein